MTDAPQAAPGITTRFGYFVVHIRSRSGGGREETSGVMENLSTGEKLGFASADELTRLVRDWGAGGVEGNGGEQGREDPTT